MKRKVFICVVLFGAMYVASVRTMFRMFSPPGSGF